MNCLVVESSPGVRRAVVRALDGIPGSVIRAVDDPAEATTGPDEIPDLIVLGWSAEDDRGLELLRELRTRTECATTPVVIVSGRTSAADVRRAAEAGATDYVLRPFAPPVLAERLARHAPETGAAEPQAA